jgi:hypothetical protein
MTAARVFKEMEAAPAPAAQEDMAFRRLLGEAGWRSLAPAIRARFAAKPLPGRAVEYAGRMAAVRASLLGRVFAQLCRLVGTPIAPYTGEDVPISVFVYRDDDGDGVVWRREYLFPGRGRTVARSVKKVDRAGGSLIECFARGVAMRMRVYAEDGSLHFLSTGYFLGLGRWRIPIPELLTPGQTHVIHADRGNGLFSFTLSVRHPVYGQTFFQDGSFRAREI